MFTIHGLRFAIKATDSAIHEVRFTINLATYLIYCYVAEHPTFLSVKNSRTTCVNIYDTFRRILTHFDAFGDILIHFDTFRHILTHFNTFRHISTHFDTFR